MASPSLACGLGVLRLSKARALTDPRGSEGDVGATLLDGALVLFDLLY